MSLISLSTIKKLCGRKGIRTQFVKGFLESLSGNRESDLTRLNQYSDKYNRNTIKACKDGITIAYKGAMKNGKPESKIL